MRVILAIVAALIAFAIALAIAGSSSWRRATRMDINALQPLAMRDTFDPATLRDAPAPVARYLRNAIPPGAPFIRSAIATQDAEFLLNGAWRRLQATQHFSMSPPGFVWDARIEIAPLIPVFVRDEYVNGRGELQASMYGIVPLANQVDTPQLNAGELQRFLGESIWFPTALLPSNAVQWTPRDDRSAFVTLTERRMTVTLLFEFGDDGMPVTISGDRYKEDNGKYALQTWRIACNDSEVRDGFTIPLRCEVAWVVDGAPQPYWRGRIASIEYQYDVME